MSALAVVCGLEAESRIARGSGGVEIVAGGGDADRIVRWLDAAAPSAVLSFGVAGGLAAGLAPGAVRVGDAVVGPDGRCFETDDAWAAALADALGVPRVTVAGVDAPLADAGGKTRLRKATAAALVDMESHVAANWAAQRGARFAVLRVVTDPAERSLPPAAMVGMRPDGSIDLPAILKSLARHPGQLPALIRTALDARAAFAALLRCRQRLGPGFALLDLG